MGKMFQVQLEVLDRKIGNEVGIARSEVMKQVEEKGALLGKELKSLVAKTDSLDKSLSEFKDMGFVSKEEFQEFWDELRNSEKIDGSDKEVDLDKVRAFARNIVEKEIEKHASDGLGRVDYALASGGARVIEHSQPYRIGGTDSWSAALKRRRGVHGNAHKMLEPSFGEPGRCFALEGSSGYVQIRLRTAIIPEAVTLEHVSKSVAYDRSSAPKDGMVFGWFGEPIIDTSNPPTLYLIARFSYDLEKSNIQTFNVEPGIASPINNVRLEIDSNHGSSALTCIYRFRVHGYEPSSPAQACDRNEL
ncbi:uncharacterized protein A4U43_C05F440 [Asparagus officinalis]|uniref:SUN domain-containing protein n=2 Tax=Asparagus officinalis TaxID=4686 RepID=A0A5P1EN95_ASPOF|nr:uncharacterized protein A4U43_C05F440 [Asparagus officinalis]